MSHTHSAPRHAVNLDIITRALEGLGRPHAPVQLGVHLVASIHHEDHIDDTCIRHLTIRELAEHVYTALYGRPSPTERQASPLEVAAAAKSARDLDAELHALMAGANSLEQQPWYPLRPGDLVHLTYDAYPGTPVQGETYTITQAAAMPEGLMDMTLLLAIPATPHSGCYAASATDDPLMEAWMEAGGHRITVVRAGVVVHNGPATGQA